MSELNSCPFCGESAALNSDCCYGWGPASTTHWVECCNCHARTDDYFTAESAVCAWNMREVTP